MLLQERISEPEIMLQLFIAIDDRIKQINQSVSGKQLPRDRRGQKPRLAGSEVITIMVVGALRGIVDKAKLYTFIKIYHLREFPALTSYSKFVEATNRYGYELKALMAQTIAQNRRAQAGYPVVFQDSTPTPVCKVVRARQHRTFRAAAHKSKNRTEWWYGFKLHVQCDEQGRLCALALTPANVDERKLLEPMTNWMNVGIVVGDKGYISAEKAYSLGQRGVQLLTGIRKNMRGLATQFQIACLTARHRVEELFEYLKCCFGLIRTTHRATYALPIHLLTCLLAYSFFKELLA